MVEIKLYEIHKSKDELTAYLKINYFGEGNEPTREDARKELENEKVVFGIDEEKFNKIFDEKLYNQEITIARGEPKTDGIDAQINYYFDVDKEVKPSEDEKGNVDYKNVNILTNAKKGDKLAELIPPVEGKDGMTVSGRKLAAYQGKLIKLPSGKNTLPDPENPNLLIAMTDGNVFSSKGVVEIDDVFEVKENVDYSTGNIDFIGSIIVKGDVKSGFTVKSGGDIEIWGVVEDAEIIANGNVLLKKGITGRGQGKIISDGNVYLKFCENQSIIAKKDVIVGEELMHSNVQCEGKVIVSGKKGFILGGRTIATLGIEAKTLGNYHHAKTEIIVGIKEELRQKMIKVEEDIKKTEENSENVKKAIYTLAKIKISKKSLPPDKQALMEKLQNLQKILPEQKEGLFKQKESVMAEYAKYAGAQIKVYSTIYPGVRVTIQNLNKNINEERKNVTISIKDNEIVII